MYKDSSCRSSHQPPPTTNVAEVALDAAAADQQQQQQTEFQQSPIQPTQYLRSVTVEDDVEEDGFSRPSETSSESECEYRSSRPSTASTTSTSSSSAVGAPAVGAPYSRSRTSRRFPTNHAHRHANSDVRLLRKIGYIASRVHYLAKIYGDFKLVNPYSPAKQRRLLQEILLKHSIHDPERETVVTTTATHIKSFTGATPIRSVTPASSVTGSYYCLPQTATEQSSFEEESVTGTVRRKSSATATVSASILLLEDLLIQLYEDRRNKVTVIRRRCSRRNSTGVVGAAAPRTTPRNHLIIMNSKTASSSVERLLQLDNEDEGGSTTYQMNATTSSHPQQQHQQQQQRSSNAFLQPILGDDNLRRRRASDCSTHTTTHQSLSNQLQITLKNNNFSKLPLHRGSCGATGEQLLAANSIANRQTLILSKSCSNVDAGMGHSNITFYASSDLRAVAAMAAAATVSSIGGSSSVGNGTGTTTTTTGGGVNAISNINGNNEYSIVQLNNTIIQCHFNDDDFRALVKDLKRKVEYTERMNWLCLSKRPMGPPHRKSSLPKHQEVKKRFLEICETTLSEEVLSALRLPAFDSYEWGDADIIHLMQTMFVELDFIEKFNIPIDTLREWLYEVYKHYNEVPFHNFRHCFCVAQMMFAITRQANLLQRLGHLECLILLVSCICHDLDHPGYNNIYQINARTELALRYNDISPLENHHCSITFRLLEHPECNIFRNFSRELFKFHQNKSETPEYIFQLKVILQMHHKKVSQIREGIIRCILATDMARHNEILTQFKEITSTFDYTNRAHINLLCMILIKVADISNEARPMDVAEPWLDRLLQEFFAQSAAEKSEGLPVTPFMDPDKISRSGSQVRFIGLVILPLFEALGNLVPEVTELIITPVRVALDYYKRLNEAQNRSRKSMADSNSAGPSGDNSGASDNKDVSFGSTTGGMGSVGGGGTTVSLPSGGNSGGSISPQMPRSQSGISVKSRRSIPSQKSVSRTSVDEQGGLPAELHDLPEGSESGDSETATEVDVAEKTSKFKVDTEGSSNRSKASHTASRKASREKRPSMIGEICSSGQRMRSSHGNIHGHQNNRNQFGANRAVSLDQYSNNSNRRLSSEGLQQVISDSNVFYNHHHNRGSLEASSTIDLGEDLNINGSGILNTAPPMNAFQIVPNAKSSDCITKINGINGTTTTGITAISTITTTAVSTTATMKTAINMTSTAHINQHNIINKTMSTSSNGSISPTQTSQTRQHCCAIAAAQNTLNGRMSGAEVIVPPKSSWRVRLKQFSEYFNFSFDKSSKRFGSTRSSPCSLRNNGTMNANTIMVAGSGNGRGGSSVPFIDPLTGKPASICCTISNNLQSPGMRQKQLGQQQHELRAAVAGRHRAYSLDVPCNRSNPRYSSSSGGGGDSSRKSSRHDGVVCSEENNSNNTLHSSSGNGSDMATCMPPPICIGSVNTSDTILITTGGLARTLHSPSNGEASVAGVTFDLGSTAALSEVPKI